MANLSSIDEPPLWMVLDAPWAMGQGIHHNIKVFVHNAEPVQVNAKDKLQ